MPEELCSVVRRGEESKDLDYKAAALWDETDKKACCELVKDILAIANTLGGYIVIGVSEVGGRWLWGGLTEQQLKSWDTTRINRFLQNYADPPINLRLQKPQCGGKDYVVLVVPRFSDTPHICQRDYPGVLAVPSLYVRTDNNESSPLKASADFRSLIEHAVRGRQDQMLEAMRSVLTGASLTASPSDRDRFSEQVDSALVEAKETDPFAGKGYEGYFVSAMFPSQFQADRFGLDQLTRAAAAAQVNYRGWPFLFYQPDGQTTVVMNDGLRTLKAWQPWGNFDSYDFWVLRRSGLLVHKTLLGEEARELRGRNDRKIIDPTEIILYITQAIDALVRLYTKLGVVDEDITWRVSLIGARNRQLKATRPAVAWWYDGYVAQTPAITYEHTHSIEDWRAGFIDLAMETSREIFLRFQWLDPTEDMLRFWIAKLLERRL